MKPFCSLLFLILTSATKAQSSKECNCSALIDVDYKGYIVIYDRPNGKVIKKLNHNFKNEDFLVLTIRKEVFNFLKVEIFYSLTENNHVIGWIKKNKAVGVYARNYDDKYPLFLYSKPDSKSKVLSVIPTWTNQLYTISKCFKKWA